MGIENWFTTNTYSLFDKTVVITGASGGLGEKICLHLLRLQANLILLNRSEDKTLTLIKKLKAQSKAANIEYIITDLEDIDSIISACEKLKAAKPDILIHNAGAYAIKRRICKKTSLDNVFQINFAAPYYITKELVPTLRQKNGRVIVVGSIAHNYSKVHFNDIQLLNCKKASLVYGNAKRFLMFSMYELFKNESNVTLSVAHPGITFTNITAHYPKLIFAIIKHPMKVIFMDTKKAALSIIYGIFKPCRYFEWIGPKIFDIWGLPRINRLKTCSKTESQQIYKVAEDIYVNIKESQKQIL